VSESASPGLPAALAWFDGLSPQRLDRIEDIYALDARFEDPFQQVQGVGAIRRIFAHMFEQLDAPRFAVTQVLAQGPQAFVTWRFEWGWKSRPGARHALCGATQWRFDAHGRIQAHVDYWDATALYETLPVLGPGLRWLRRRMRA
jgi:steroid delta-isomerase